MNSSPAITAVPADIISQTEGLLRDFAASPGATVAGVEILGSGWRESGLDFACRLGGG